MGRKLKHLSLTDPEPESPGPSHINHHEYDDDLKEEAKKKNHKNKKNKDKKHYRRREEAAAAAEALLKRKLEEDDGEANEKRRVKDKKLIRDKKDEEREIANQKKKKKEMTTKNPRREETSDSVVASEEGGGVKESSVAADGGEEREENKREVVEEEARESESESESDGDGVGVGVVVSGDNIEELKYAALKSFKDSALPAELLKCCKGFRKPSPIQSHAWPFLLNARDFIGIAATGSGKTIAYGVPAIWHVLTMRKDQTSEKVNPLCLVLSPTRELAQQISNVLCDAGRPSSVKSVCLYGGTSKEPQISSLKSGVDIVIATPGRLKDLVETGYCCLKEVSYVVLDEADRMLDLGFEPEVRVLVSQTCSARQMVMFSATWPLSVNQLAREFMDPNPVKVVVGSEDLAANHDVMQIVEVLDDQSRDERLIALLGKYHKSQQNRVLVFVLYKKEAGRVENMLQRKGWKAVSIHGDRSQYARKAALTLFKDGICPLMIATDVAARGLDIPDVEVVINYSFPLTTEDYVHRIGRTGRAGKKGVAHTFFMPQNKGMAWELVNVLREAGQDVPVSLSKFGTHVKEKESKVHRSHLRENSENAPKSSNITLDED